MNTVIRTVNIDAPEKEYLREAGEILRKGGLVAFPTETVYGLGGNALDEDAAKKIYGAKGRPSDNPLIVHIQEESELISLVKTIPPKAKKMMEAFWPGPLTMIFEKSDKVPHGTTGGLETVAVRMPNHPVALGMIKSAGVPIAAPSANTSGRPSPTLAQHVEEDLSGKIEMILDGGAVGIGIESTILDMTQETPMILRPGYITKGMIENIIGKVEVDKVVVAKSVAEIDGGNYKPKAPGMKYKHYAPKADLIMFEGQIDRVTDAIKAMAKEKISSGYKVGIIATEETKVRYNADMVVSIGTRTSEETIAQGLYKVLRDFDETDVDVILGETFYEDELGCAIMNRLIKAAGYKLVQVG